MVQTDDIRKAFAERLKEAMSDFGLPVWGGGRKLAELAGLTPKAISKWLNCEAMPRRDHMLQMANVLKVRIEWLQYGSGAKSATAQPSEQNLAPLAALPAESSTEVDQQDDKYAHIPQLTAKAAAGLGAENPHVESNTTLAFKRDWLRAKGAKAENLLVIYAEGESMWPTINDHDVLLVDKSRIEPADGHVFVLSSTDKGAIVKRLVQSPLGGWIIRSDNKDKAEYGDLLLSRSDVNEHRIIGRVIWRGGDL